ncbi:uncharacterized protein LOC142975250 [Anticarsia gemmatalis]|uniref:uncharacterized protein LOC142975250 n=1 Tax=Anticarsia gemmatalis TaxID=129554 RepID=UPI003F76FB7C
MKKKARSEVTLPSIAASDFPAIYSAPLDVLTVKVHSLRVPDDEPRHYALKVTYSDQLVLTGIIKSLGAKDTSHSKMVVSGTVNYDPSDYEKMCLLADSPLVVNVQPLKSVEFLPSGEVSRSQQSDIIIRSKSNSTKSSSFAKQPEDISCCNIDIMSIMISEEANPKMFIKKRMEPMIKPTALQCKSWDCLPLLTIEITINRHEENAEHHNVLKNANWMRITLAAAYNMLVPFDKDYIYTAATKTPLNRGYNEAVATYIVGSGVPKRYDHTNFYPKWESLKFGDNLFTNGDEKMTYKLSDIINEKEFDLNYYMTQCSNTTVVWGSFHRTLLLKETEDWLIKHIRGFKWPLEVHIYGEDGGFSFMAFLNLFQLLYPGEDSLCIAVPLLFINSASMQLVCDCQLLLTPNEKAPSSSGVTQKGGGSRNATESSISTEGGSPRPTTGYDENDAFVLIEIKLGRPLKKIVIPRPILEKNIDEMLKEVENTGCIKRQCSGRGQRIKDWQATVRAAATSLRRVPYYGMTEFCSFNRQLSETRTRVELTTSCWQEAAVYVNNNFIIQQYLGSDELFEELVMMSHACLMRIARDTLLAGDVSPTDTDSVLKAARQARQMQDTYHAMELYMQMIVKRPYHASNWRELSTCLKDIDGEWANVCLNKALVLDPRHPLSLLSKGGMVFETDPGGAEMFFVALLAFYPFWTTAWIIASAYYFDREYFLMSDKILEIVQRSRQAGVAEELGYARTWERELGDWWDFTPLLPGTSQFYDAADLLLRLRCVTLAEVCVARALTQTGESSAYYHLVALCCRLRGEYQDALCHIRVALEKYGEIGYLRSLEAECYHRLGNVPASMESYEKAGNCGSSFSTLMAIAGNKEPQRIRSILVDLVRQKPSAFSWMALAQDWMTKAKLKAGEAGDANKAEEQTAAKTCAAACAVEALKWDRQAGSAWALLAGIVKPSARRRYCFKMATLCGHKSNICACLESNRESEQSLCYRLGTPLLECNCQMCQRLKL